MQVRAFRNGLSVFVGADLRAQLRSFCTPGDFQLLVCGAESIDVAEWRRETRYEGGFDTDSQIVLWFWDVVERMTDDERSKLLHFCTGSSRMPGGGISALMG